MAARAFKQPITSKCHSSTLGPRLLQYFTSQKFLFDGNQALLQVYIIPWLFCQILYPEKPMEKK